MSIIKIVAVSLILSLWAAVVHAGTHHHYYTDPQGNVLAKTDAQGNIIATYDYAPYGAAVASMSGSPNGPGYTGHVNDPESGFVYMQARYYDAGVGRMLSVDPVGPTPGNIFNFNRYTYANNNPIVNIDPNGEATVYNYPEQKSILVVQTFKNNGIQYSDAQIAQQGANLSGQASDGTMVRVQLIPGSDSDAVQLNPNSKLNDISLNQLEHSHADKIGGRNIEIAPNAHSPGTVGHEIGHTLRAGDQHGGGISANGKRIDADVPGPINIMKDAVGQANKQTIDEIQQGTKSPENKQFTCHATGSGNSCQ